MESTEPTDEQPTNDQSATDPTAQPDPQQPTGPSQGDDGDTGPGTVYHG